MNGSFTILLICIKHICDIINVIPVNEKIFHSEKKKTTQTDSPLLRVIKSNALFSFSIWPHIQKSILNKNICVLFQHLRTDKKSDMYLCRRGTYSPPLSFFVLFAWYKPSARKKKKNPPGYWAYFPLWPAIPLSFEDPIWQLSRYHFHFACGLFHPMKPHEEAFWNTILIQRLLSLRSTL